jgi:hypothetical protein
MTLGKCCHVWSDPFLVLDVDPAPGQAEAPVQNVRKLFFNVIYIFGIKVKSLNFKHF